MSTFNSIEEAREFFKNDRFATDNGMTIDEIGDGYARCSMDILDCHRNAAGGVMGGVIFTLADFAFAVSSNNAHNLTVAISCSINYLNGPKGGRLYAYSKCIKDGRTTCVYDIDVTDDTGRAVAKFTGTGHKFV